MSPDRTTATSDSDSDPDVVLIDRDDVSNYNPGQLLPQDPEALHAVRIWLQPTAYDVPGGEFKKHLASHVSGTGTWLTSSTAYQQWLHGSEHGLLWIRGIPGSGKSVMAAKLIDRLARSNPECPVLFFFFRQIIDANHAPEALLRDWIDQLLPYSPPLQANLVEYVKHRRVLSSFSIDDLWKELKIAIAQLPGKVYCVGDALDEMDCGHDAFLEALGHLGRWRPEKVKVLITSRPVPSVETPLRKVPCLHLRLEEKLVDVDISTYVRYTLSNSKIPESDWKTVEDAVPGRANGLFLYAKLAMDAFLDEHARVDDVLPRLPLDLNALYTGLLDEHAKRSGVEPSIQRLILQFVTHARRPLRLLELTEIIRVYSADGMTLDLKATKNLIRHACGPLIEILPDETVSVVHHSFTEYLKGATRTNDPSGYPILRKGPTHAELGRACLRYLQSGCLDQVDTPRMNDLDTWGSFTDFFESIPHEEAQLRLRHPFFEYAASNWHRHVASSESAGYDQAGINVELRKFLGGEFAQTWLAFRWERSHEGVTPLHIAARVGLVSYVKELLETVEVDVRHKHGKTPLWWAAHEGQATCIRELVAAGANPDQEDDENGLKPLHQAAERNHHDAVKVLLEAGVDPLTEKTKDDPGRKCGNAPTSKGHTPLMYACQKGHVESLEAFLPFLGDADTTHRALGWAADKGQAKVVARLLSCPGADPNKTVGGDTLLFRACGSFDLDTIKTLLKAGADPNIGSRANGSEFARMSIVLSPDFKTRRFSCMHQLCGLVSNRAHRNHDGNDEGEVDRAIFCALVEAGADIHARDPDGQTPLHGAARISPVLTRLLLDAGSNANATDSSDSTPLHEAQSPEVVDLLIDLGNVDASRKDKRGMTPLHSMLANIYTHRTRTAHRLIERAPDCDATNADGDSALHMAVKRTNPASLELVDALLERGANPNVRNREGLTPLLALDIDPSRFSAILDRLVKAGADVDAVDRKGATALLRLSWRHPMTFRGDLRGVMKCLLDRGARASVRDYKGRTMLHWAVASCDCSCTRLRPSDDRDSRLDFALSLGLAPTVVDDGGNGLLHQLALRRENHSSDESEKAVKLWERLLALGLPLGQKNSAGRTPLHVLCAGYDQRQERVKGRATMPIDYVISRTEALDVADEEGNTPLHSAAATSQLYTKKLLDAGADPMAVTGEGMAPLHIAARCGRSNIVGLLLDAMRKSQPDHTESPENTPAQSRMPVLGVNIRVPDKRNLPAPLTPLYYACQSGRPETVALLLEAGADVREGNIFAACAGFEPPRPSSSRNPWELEADDTTRIEEILDMLLTHGADISLLDIFAWSGRVLTEALEDSGDYAIACFRDFRRKTLGRDGSPMKHVDEALVFTEFLQPYLKEASARALAEFKLVKPEQDNRGLFRRFMVRREYHLVEELARMGPTFLPIPGRDCPCNLAVLIRHGFASLVDKIATQESAAQFTKGDCHAHCDSSRPDLWLTKGALSQAYGAGNSSPPFVIEAVHRDLPNMEVLRLLVEKFSVDVNEMHYTYRYDGGKRLAPLDSALHYVALGKSWWHVYQALPYLLGVGADLEARNSDGQTPLLLALGGTSHRNYMGPFSRDAAEMLIAAGADVNAVDGGGQSCLACAQHDVPMLERLISDRATVTVDAALAAVSARNLPALKTLLSSGISVNAYRERDPGQKDAVILCESPLLAAVSTKHPRTPENEPEWDESEVKMQIVRLLLEHGADPFAKFYKKLWWSGECTEGPAPSAGVPEGYKEVTILHHVFHSGFLVEPFLDIPGLDVNRQDAEGQTLLLAASRGPKGLDYTVGSKTGSEQKVSIFQRLLSLGADLSARDNRGRNILHHIIDGAPRSDKAASHSQEALKTVFADAPHLLQQGDSEGQTPLHYAVAQAAEARSPKMARVLLAAGADPRAVDSRGDTALHILARNLEEAQLRALFEELVGRGLDPNARNGAGETPLFAFSRRSRKSWTTRQLGFPDRNEDGGGEALQMLRRLGVDFHARDNRGRGALHVAAAGDVARFKELMRAGVDGMVEDGAGQTAVDVAAACGNRLVLELFEGE